VDEFAAETGRGCLRFDYSGHGDSSGDIRDGTIGRWLAECHHVFDTYAEGPQIIIGSSMGGYLATLMARDLVARSETDRIAALVLIAPAIDMTERLLWNRLDAATRKVVQDEGEWLRPSEYDDTVQVFTQRLFDEGREHLLFDGPPLTFPFQTVILQGRLDDAVPPDVSLDLAGLIEGDVTLSLIHQGDHRLSSPEDIAMLLGTISQLG
jgi:pimeloyl-ACP methyl ester carboxylesterase